MLCIDGDLDLLKTLCQEFFQEVLGANFSRTKFVLLQCVVFTADFIHSPKL